MTAAPVSALEAAGRRSGAAPLAAGLAAIAAAAAAINAGATLNHDVAWILTGAQRLADGGEFGRDVIDVNPPLAWWIAMLPASLGRALGIHAAAAFVAFTIVLCLGSIGLTQAALDRTPDQPPGRTAFLLLCGAVLMIVPGYNFGQREHLMLIAALPYVAAAAANRSAGGRLPPLLGWTIGAFAAIGFCLKPHFLIVPAAIEIWRLSRGARLAESFRPETLAIAATGAAYAAAVALWAPSYLWTVAPEAASTYWAYSGSLAGVAAGFAEALWPTAVAVAILAAALRRAAVPPLAMALLAAAAGAAAAAALQMKGWSYQLLPAVGLSALACAAAVRGARPALGPGVKAAAILCILAGTFYPAWQHADSLVRGSNGTVRRVERLAAALRANAGPEGSVFAFVTSPRDAHPAVLLAGVRWAGSACCVHHLPAAARAGERSEEERPEIRLAARRQLEEILTRLESERPAVLLIDDGPNKLGFRHISFDYRAFLGRDPRFERLFGGYEEGEPVERFRLFVRRGDTTAGGSDAPRPLPAAALSQPRAARRRSGW